MSKQDITHHQRSPSVERCADAPRGPTSWRLSWLPACPISKSPAHFLQPLSHAVSVPSFSTVIYDPSYRYSVKLKINVVTELTRTKQPQRKPDSITFWISLCLLCATYRYHSNRSVSPLKQCIDLFRCETFNYRNRIAWKYRYLQKCAEHNKAADQFGKS